MFRPAVSRSAIRIASRTVHAALVAATALALAACGNSLSGTYGKKGGVQMQFHSNGKVEILAMGMTQESTYVVEDGKVKLGAGEGKGTLVMKIDAKGCLDGGLFYGTMCKQS